MKTKALFLWGILFLWISASFGQEESRSGIPNFYLDCSWCDFDFVRQELPFISFVRDPNLADVHILATRSQTGSGGNKFFINFIGRNKLEGQNLEYEYLSDQSATSDDRRNGLLKYIQAGVLHYYSLTGNLEKMNIDLESSSGEKVAESLDDPWKLWIFRISAGGDFAKEESQNEFAYSTELSAEKVTEAWKTEISGEYEIDTENYFDEGEKITNEQKRSMISAEYIKSLTAKWSAGVFTDYSSSNYINVKNRFALDVGAEYNLFPWDVSNRKVFTFRYKTGVQVSDYERETIYDKTGETLFYESLGLNLEMVQPWGRVEARLEGRHYFHDFTKNRLTLESDLSVRLSKQISFYCEATAEVIHDQLYLPKGNASLEDVLLRRQKLATTYELGGELGIRYTFGSMYNNVVNERF